MSDQKITDIEDFYTLMRAILRSAVSDYITLQHPSKRLKSDTQAAFASAVDMLFDDEYTAMKLRTPEKLPMGLREIVAGAHPHNAIDITTMRHNIAAEADSYWQGIEMRTLHIPEQLAISGYVYTVLSTPGASSIDFDNYCIRQDLSLGQQSEKQFIDLCMQISIHHADIKLSKAAISALTDKWFELLRMNVCFNNQE